MDIEYQGLCAISASAEVYFYLFLACCGVFRIIISLQQNSEELRLWWHRRRYARFMRASHQLRR